MRWSNNTSKIDGGVLLMRHMEMYFGEKESEWDIGIPVRSKKVFRFLRAKYCSALLTSDNNNQALENIAKAVEHFKKENKAGNIDVEHIVATFLKSDDYMK